MSQPDPPPGPSWIDPAHPAHATPPIPVPTGVLLPGAQPAAPGSPTFAAAPTAAFGAGHVVGALVGGFLLGLLLPAVALFALVSATGGSFIGLGGRAPSSPASAAPALPSSYEPWVVRYSVQSASDVTITYGVDGHIGTARAAGAGNWTRSDSVDDYLEAELSVTLDPSAKPGAKASCQIEIDDLVVATAEAVGPGATATCRSSNP